MGGEGGECVWVGRALLEVSVCGREGPSEGECLWVGRALINREEA